MHTYIYTAICLSAFTRHLNSIKICTFAWKYARESAQEKLHSWYAWKHEHFIGNSFVTQLILSIFYTTIVLDAHTHNTTHISQVGVRFLGKILLNELIQIPQGSGYPFRSFILHQLQIQAHQHWIMHMCVCLVGFYISYISDFRLHQLSVSVISGSASSIIK